jgi:hypothetical protein
MGVKEGIGKSSRKKIGWFLGVSRHIFVKLSGGKGVSLQFSSVPDVTKFGAPTRKSEPKPDSMYGGKSSQEFQAPNW